MRQYVEVVQSNGHVILNQIDILHATRLNNTNGGTIIDHIITDNITLSYTLSLNDTPITDHRYFHITINKYKQQQTKTNQNKTFIDYHKITQNEIITIQNSPNIESFIKHIKNSINKNTITQTNNSRKTSITPWINKETIKQIELRNNYFKLKIKYPHNEYYSIKFK